MLIGAFLLALPVLAQPDPNQAYLTMLEAGRRAAGQRNLAEAERHYQLALLQAEAAGEDSPELVACLLALGRIYADYPHRDYPKAEVMLARALGIQERVYGRQDPRVADSLAALVACAYGPQGKRDAVRDALARVLIIREVAWGAEDPRLLETLAGLAPLYPPEEATRLTRRMLTLGEAAYRQDDAALLALLDRVVAMGTLPAAERQAVNDRRRALIERLYADRPAERAAAYGRQADFFMATSQAVRALPDYQRALALRATVLKQADTDNIGLLYDAAECCRVLGRYDEGLPFYRRLLALTTADAPLKRPPPHSATYRLGDLYGQMVALAREAGRPKDTEALLQEWVARFEATRALESPEGLRGLYALAQFYEETGRPAEAEKTFERAITMLEKAHGSESAWVADSATRLAACLQRQGKLDDATAIHARLLQIALDRNGPDHPSTAYASLPLGALLEAQGKTAEATLLYRQAQQVLGDRYPLAPVLAPMRCALYAHHLAAGRAAEAKTLEKLVTDMQLGAYYQGRGDFLQAELVFTRELEATEANVASPNHALEMYSALEALADLYLAWKRPARAAPLLARALSYREQIFGADSYLLAPRLMRLGALYLSLGQPTAARPLLERALRLQTVMYGPDDAHLAAVRGLLAQLPGE